jgi:zinc/manganese transport system substrate-binding protein/zinc transport system substrate-binding protein
MKNRALISTIALLVVIGLVFTLSNSKKDSLSNKEHGKSVVLASTFPIFQVVRNVVNGSNEVKAELMLPSQMGCPHDYVLTPQDMRKLATADVLVINGLGMEEFLGAPLKKANAKLQLIDSSRGITALLNYNGAGGCSGCSSCDSTSCGTQKPADNTISTINPHLWVSPRLVKKLAKNIAEDLSKIYPKSRELFLNNADKFSKKLTVLIEEFETFNDKLANNRIIQTQGIFDYLARDAGLQIVGIMQHYGQEPSAAELIELVKIIENTKAGAIFSQPQYSDKVARTLAKQTGIKIIKLDPLATGPDSAPIDYYESKMRENIEIIKEALGKK